MMFFTDLFKNDLFVMSFAVLTGLAIGQLRLGRISLGISGTLFTGLIIGFFGHGISRDLFTWNLVIFVVSVGLLAAEDVVIFVRRFGFRFVALSVAVTGSGALTTWVFARLFGSGIHPHVVAGTYVGALTSSPGLGAAMEAVSGGAAVAAGYTIAYPFGVLAVVLFVQIVPLVFGIDNETERRSLKDFLSGYKAKKDGKEESVFFSLASFTVCMMTGLFIGTVSIPLPVIGSLRLGGTGGALIGALILGAFGSIGPLPMRMDRRMLSALRDLSLAFFLAAVGLMSGPGVVDIFRESGWVLVFVGTVTALVSLGVGYILGRVVWKMNWVLLAGAICGAMTSTPGLGAAIDATKSEECAAGYGATYPVALFCMVLFTTLIVKSFAAG
ncbi:MAG: YidE/YbjL duplication [Thermovirgaceae bacterium]